MSTFTPRIQTLTATIVLNGAIDDVFPLFSPEGEREWVNGWNPEVLRPADHAWTEGMIFRTIADGCDEIWAVAEMSAAAHRVVYFRIEPNRLVARVEVSCRAFDATRTQATIQYSYTGLSSAGNASIEEWTDAAYRSKMDDWTSRIDALLARRASE